MRWDKEAQDAGVTIKAFRPRVTDVIVGPARKNRHPAVQAEIERRVAIYAHQVEQTGRIRWLPYLGSGK